MAYWTLQSRAEADARASAVQSLTEIRKIRESVTISQFSVCRATEFGETPFLSEMERQRILSHSLAFLSAGQRFPSATPSNELIEVASRLYELGSYSSARIAVNTAVIFDRSFLSRFNSLRMLSFIDAADSDFVAARNDIQSAVDLIDEQAAIGIGERLLLIGELTTARAAVEFMESPGSCAGFLTIHNALENGQFKNSPATYILKRNLNFSRDDIARATIRNIKGANTSFDDLEKITGLSGSALDAFKEAVQEFDGSAPPPPVAVPHGKVESVDYQLKEP
jgi:hypothetical protein